MNTSAIPCTNGLIFLIQAYHQRSGLTDDDILQCMGYRESMLPSARAGLQRFLQAPVTTWFASEFDWYLFHIEFMTALANVLSIPEALLSAEVDKLRETRLPEPQNYLPRIDIQTDFIRRGTPLFALSALVSLRQINLHQAFGRQSVDTQYQQATQLAVEHFQCSRGKLPVWGEITGYSYQNSQGDLFAIELA